MKYGRKVKTSAVMIQMLRELKTIRRPPGVEHSVFYTPSTDRVELFCTLLGRNPEKAVVVAHPAVVGGYYKQVVALAEELSRFFSVVLFDFRGHGKSTGACNIGFTNVSEDLKALVNRVRGMGFERIGVAGFSMGAAAAMLLAARDECFEALVSIGCPPSIPAIPLFEEHPLMLSATARIIGMRLDPMSDNGPYPIDVAVRLPGIPKLLIFGEHEVVPAEDIREFTELVSGPKKVLTVPGAWHADLMGGEGPVRQWLEENL